MLSLIRIDRRSHLSVTVRCYCSTRRFLKKKPELKCSLETNEIQALRKCLVSGFAAILLLSQTGQGVALDLSSGHQNICQLGNAALEENKLTLPLENASDGDMMMI